MKTTIEVVKHIEEIITNIYLRPAMYGGTVDEVEQALWIYHGVWVYITERHEAYTRADLLASEAAGSGSMGFSSTYRKLHPHAPDSEILMFGLKHWAMVTERLAITLPSEFPDARHSFSPDILATDH
jgi:hypothetical protein